MSTNQPINVLCADISATSEAPSGYFSAKLYPIRDGVVNIVSSDRNCGHPMTFRHAGDDVFVDVDGRRIAIYARMPGEPVQVEDVTEPFEREIFVLSKKIDKVLEMAQRFGGTQIIAHREWFVDQMVRILVGADYEVWVNNFNDFNDGDGPPWGTGVAP